MSLSYESIEMRGMTKGEVDRVVFSVAQSDLLP
jgi:hypothetical protein